MGEISQSTGRTIQMFLVNGTPHGLVVASIHGWTGSVLVGTQSTFVELTKRSEADRTGVYILYGPDPDDALKMRAYIGEADSVRERIRESADLKAFWETAVIVTTSDEALTKGHVRYLEARLIELAKQSDRATLENLQAPPAESRWLPEADRANMEAFLENLKVVLPVVGVDLLKPRPATTAQSATRGAEGTRFEIRHRSNVSAYAAEEDGEFVVLEGSRALKNPGYKTNQYAELKRELVDKGVLVEASAGAGDMYEFRKAYAFKSPTAAAAVVLDRNANGRTVWKVVGSNCTYHEWQESQATGTPAPT